MSQLKFIETSIIAMTIFNANNTIMTPIECADFLGVHYNTIMNRIKDKTILSTLVGGKHHIPKIQFLKKIINKFKNEEGKTIEELIGEDLEVKVKKIIAKQFQI